MHKKSKDYLDQFDFGFALTAVSTALLIIDMQYASASRTSGLGRNLEASGQADFGRFRFDRIENVCIPAIQQLLRYFRGHGLRIIYVTIGSYLDDFSDLPPKLRMLARANNNRVGQREHQILDEIKPQLGDVVINKTTTGAFQSTGLASMLRTFGISDLLFCGVSTDLCVESTARVAADLGYNCVLVEDGCASSSPDRHASTMRVFDRFLGRVCTSDELMRELSQG